MRMSPVAKIVFRGHVWSDNSDLVFEVDVEVFFNVLAHHFGIFEYLLAGGSAEIDHV